MWLLTYYFLVIMGRFTAALRGVPPHLVRLIKSSLSEKITILYTCSTIFQECGQLPMKEDYKFSNI